MENMPYLNAAFFCENLIEGKDNVFSAIRIVDRMEYELQTNVAEMVDIKPAISLTGLIILKSGPALGKHTFQIDLVKPSGKSERVVDSPFELKGGEHAQNFRLNLVIVPDEDGLHWFEVRVNENLLTKMSLTLVRKQRTQSADLKTSG